jgi:crossover junction endodeoxyribonuclease RusA
MSAALRITLPYPPSANRYWRAVNGRVLISSEARNYKRHVVSLARVARWQPIKGDVVLDVTVYRPQRSGDLDNRLKVAIDAVRGVLFGDDKQVAEIHAYRREDKDNPRVEIVARATGDAA